MHRQRIVTRALDKSHLRKHVFTFEHLNFFIPHQKSRHLKTLPFYPSFKAFWILLWMFCNKTRNYINIALIPDTGLRDTTVKSQYTVRLTVVL